MALLDEILGWTKSSLMPWQQDAARRLFQQPKGLTTQDMDELYALLKAAHGLPNPGALKPIPLAASHLPSKIAGGDTVILKSMRDMKHVNRIVPGQMLRFSPSGLTAIFGDNGTGKSGYSRVLKRACRARDQTEIVHPDATDPKSKTAIPEAVFDIEFAGLAKPVNWKRDEVPPDELSNIAVFDAHCARVYLTTEQDAAYLPYGLSVVEDLANKVLPGLAIRLSTEAASVSVDTQPFTHLLGDTAVGKLIVQLGYKTDITKLKSLGILTPKELERRKALEKTLAEEDPKARAHAVRQSAQRLESLTGRIDKSAAWVSVEAVTKLKGLADDSAAATQAEKLAAEGLRAGETLLPGTGEPIWKALFDAAQRYSTVVAYTGHKFPHTQNGAVCVLCQQPLADGADRLNRFDTFIKDEAAKNAEQRRNLLGTSVQRISQADLSVLFEDALRAEIATFESALPEQLDAFEKAIAARQAAMLVAVDTGKWGSLPVLSVDPRPRLRETAVTLNALAADLLDASDVAQRQVLTKERDELKARESLASVLAAVLDLVARMKLKHNLDACKDDLKTRAISEKSKEFASSAVTKALEIALNDEFKGLGIGHIRTKLVGRNDKGKTKHRLELDLPSSTNLQDILSEGEQRAIAIGSFLAELRLGNHKGGIVFDDPVSSLDHWHRRQVALRLAEEAKHRQVIVLTHDTVFLADLIDAVEEKNVPHLMQNLECRSDVPGYVSEGLPWDHQGYKERILELKKDQKILEKKPWPSHPSAAESREMRGEYDRLRSTIERVVQDVVFSGVVRRHHNWIRLSHLRKVVGFPSTEEKEIDRLYKKCHDVISGHDPSSGKQAPVPTAAELAKDIADLEALIATTIARQKAIAKTP